MTFTKCHLAFIAEYECVSTLKIKFSTLKEFICNFPLTRLYNSTLIPQIQAQGNQIT